MITIEVNGNNVEAKPDETILAVLNRLNIRVPTLCHMPQLFPSGACRLCVVELLDQNRLVTSCSFKVYPNMKIKTHSSRVLTARKTIVELLLANHPDDCLYCDRNNNCELQSLSDELGVRERRYGSHIGTEKIDTSNPCIIRNPSKCILCGRCVRVCEEVQGVSAIDFTRRGAQSRVSTAFDKGMNISSCINCGQCITVCPTGALTEHPHIKSVIAALNDPKMHVMIQVAPSISVTIGEAFGMPIGHDYQGLLTAALRRIGFHRVFDTSFSADLTIMEEASELVHRIQTDGVLPMMTSCSPGWIKYVEQFYPEMIPHLSSCKSPQQMMGALIKSFYAQKKGLNPKTIFCVSVMPCTAKKFEAGRPEMTQNGLPDIDAVLTTRELIKLIKRFGIDFSLLSPEAVDSPFGTRSSAGKIFGGTGGVMEAAVRTAYYLITKTDLPQPMIKPLRDLNSRKETRIKINDLEIGVAVVSGLKQAKQLLEELKNGRKDLHFIEVMTCPNGCIAGGGQPFTMNRDAVKARLQALYAIDKKELVRTSYANPDIQQLYREFLEAPLSHKSHELLHTHYAKREAMY